MILQIDTIAMTIAITEDTNMTILLDTLEELLPNEKWRDFSLKTNVMILANNPTPVIVLPGWAQPPFTQPNYPWITYTTFDTNPNSLSFSDKIGYGLKNGVYDVEITYNKEG